MVTNGRKITWITVQICLSKCNVNLIIKVNFYKSSPPLSKFFTLLSNTTYYIPLGLSCLRLQSWQRDGAFCPALYPPLLYSWQREIVLCCTFRWQLTRPGTCLTSGRGESKNRSRINADCQPDSLIVAHVASQVIRSVKMIKTWPWESYCLGQSEGRTRLNKPLMGVEV